MLADIEPRSRTVEEGNIYKGLYPLPDIHAEQYLQHTITVDQLYQLYKSVLHYHSNRSPLT